MASKKTQFKKGTSGNPAGKPKGAKNRTTEEIRNFIQQVVDKNLVNLEADLSLMNATNRWTVIDKLTKYFLPALSKNDNNNINSGDVSITVKYEDILPPIKEDNKFI